LNGLSKYNKFCSFNKRLFAYLCTNKSFVETLRKLLNKLPRFMRNQYFIAILIFVVWIVFIDRNNIISQYRLRKQLHNLKQEERFYINASQKDSLELYKLRNDSAYMEKVGREKYLMKKDSEDIFIIRRKKAE
jgi:cell division protein DivIC